MEEDQWLKLQQQKAQLPNLHKWRHRVRVLEHVLMDAHPDRDHIKRVLASEEAQAVTDAKALMRTQELTGTGAIMDIKWPPRNAIAMSVGRPGRTIPGMEVRERPDAKLVK